MICPKCEKEITDSEYRMVAFDVPYLNVRFHRICYMELDDPEKFIIDNLEKIMSENKEKLKKITKK